jgi:methylation protein EvaC
MKCKLCSSDELIEVINLGQQPLANKYPTPEQFKSEKFYELLVLFCRDCKTVQLDKIISRDEMFTEYFYLSSVNPGLVRHFEELAWSIARKRPNYVIDIGSNDGVLLEPLKKHKIKAIGIEPSKNVSQIAMNNGLITLNRFFDDGCVEQILSENTKPDVIVCSSVFTHLEDPHTFIKNVKKLLNQRGTFIVEVEYIRNIIQHGEFERFYFDRIFYYSLTSFKMLFEQYDMEVFDAEEIEPHGGSLRIYIRHKSYSNEMTQRCRSLLQQEDGLNSSAIHTFEAETRNNVRELVNLLVDYKAQGKKVVGYGAPARLATITNYANIGKALISYVIDDSPLKAGKTTPGIHIPIFERSHLNEDIPDIIIVFAWEYYKDIKEKTNELGARYLRPIPPAVLN